MRAYALLAIWLAIGIAVLGLAYWRGRGIPNGTLRLLVYSALVMLAWPIPLVLLAGDWADGTVRALRIERKERELAALERALGQQEGED